MTTEIANLNPQNDPVRMARSLRASAQQPVETEAQAQMLMKACETLRQPVKREWLMGRIATLLSHFYVSPMSETEVRAVAEDWAAALGAFPQWAVAEACAEWLRSSNRKPTIADIRKLSQQHFAVVEFTRQKAMRGPKATPKPEHGKITEEQRAQMAEAGNAALKRMVSKMERGA